MSQNTSLLTLSVMLTASIAACRFITPLGAPAGADANTLGVTRSAGATAEKVSVDVIGTAIVEAGAAIAAGATLKSDSLGRAITWATSGAKVGLALEPATTAGQLIEVLLIDNVA